MISGDTNQINKLLVVNEHINKKLKIKLRDSSNKFEERNLCLI